MNGGHRGVPGARSPALASCFPRKMCSWMLSCCFALQHLAVQTSLLCIFHLLLLPTLPEELPQATSELLARSLFACGISTVLQTTLGSRLPLVQIPSFEYLVPAMVLGSHLSLSASMDRNGTAVASACPAPHCTVAGSQAASLREAHAPCCHLLPAPGVLPPALLRLSPGSEGLHGAISPHPAHVLGEWGWPLLTPQALAVGIAMAIGCSMNSVGCYVLCGRLLRAPRLPPHACNRGLCMEGLGSLLAGLLGTPGGTAASIANACAIGFTQTGSRFSVQISALVCVVLGTSPRLAGLLTRIPLAIHGGVLCVTYAVAVGTGISYFQYADIDSGRNIFIVGFAMFMALLVPRWLGVASAHLATGWVPLDLLFLSLLMVPVFLTGFLSFFMENTVSGTLEERGLLSDLSLRKAGPGSHHHPCGERDEASQVYGLPPGLRRLMPSSCKAFPCCFLCPGSEEEEEEGEESSRAPEEGTAAPGEGTQLLPRPGSGEQQPPTRPSEMEMSTWHTEA
ncbi:solute carrier family 23 member 3-like isoform X4 [Rissa tridactyla]|uniref:solute carrier family 23 member 3-like isoform X4 n=1 Tax=Rissa tridactyla TaxID=75485 RepID=UPI0023BA4D16|nr:solute carrier family 23 member 3-like isoform X4 [Rissa tridactyla]